MAFVIADRVRETSVSTGTGNFTLDGAVTGYQTFDAVLDSADTTYYTIAAQGGSEWEVGIGTFTAPATLARTTILSSSNGGSIVTFSAGSKDVFISLPASKTVQSFSAGSTGLTPSTASFGAVTLGGTLAIANGGTGSTTASAALTALGAVAKSGDTMTGTLEVPSLKIQSTGGGSVTLNTPSTASNFTATFPANTGNVVTTGSSAVVTQAMLASNVVGNGPAFSAYLSTNQNVTTNVLTKVQVNTEEFDTNSNYDNSTNYRFTPTVAGYYQIDANVIILGGSMTVALATIYKNGAEFKRGGQISYNSGNASVFGAPVSALIYLNGSTDYVELYAQGTGTSPYFLGGQQYVWFSGVLVRAA